jgi:hypothetical protein
MNNNTTQDQDTVIVIMTKEEKLAKTLIQRVARGNNNVTPEDLDGYGTDDLTRLQNELNKYKFELEFDVNGAVKSIIKPLNDWGA